MNILVQSYVGTVLTLGDTIRENRFDGIVCALTRNLSFHKRKNTKARSLHFPLQHHSLKVQGVVHQRFGLRKARKLRLVYDVFYLLALNYACSCLDKTPRLLFLL